MLSYTREPMSDPISIIIPTFRRPGLLDRCLKSLFGQDLAGVGEVVLVVHEQDADTARLVERWACEQPLVRAVFTAHASRSHARNEAVRVAAGYWAYFLDDDVVLDPGTISRLRSLLAAYPYAEALGGPNQVPAQSPAFELCADYVLSSRLGAGRMRSRYAGGGAPRPADERDLIACNLAVRLNALREEGGFDERMDYGEETLLLARWARAGRRMLYAPELRVRHARRSGWRAFFKQAFHSGVGRGRQSLLLPSSFSAEFLGPPLLLAVFAAAALSFDPSAAAACIAYLLLCLFAGVRAAFSLGAPSALARVPFLTAGGHLFYGAGMLWGALKQIFFQAGGPSKMRLRQALAEAALWLGRKPLAKPFLLLYYQAALWALRLSLRGGALPARELWLYRGAVEEGWTPGGSDIDLIAELAVYSPEEEPEVLERLDQEALRLRERFPVIGELRAAASPELGLYRRGRSLRARAFARRARRLSRADNGAAQGMQDSSFVELPSPDVWDRAYSGLDAWTEQLHAHLGIANIAFGQGHSGRAGRARYNGRKLLLDVLRHREPGSWPKEEPPSRREAQREERCGEAIREMDSEADAGRALLRALAVSAEALEQSGRSLIKAMPPGSTPAAVQSSSSEQGHEAESFSKECGCLRQCLGGTVRAAVHDDARHLLLALGDIPSDAGFWKELSRFKLTLPAFAGPMVPLGEASLKLALLSGFGEDPLRAFSVQGVLSCAAQTRGLRDPQTSGECRIQACSGVSGSSALLRRHHLSLWQVEEVLLPPMELLRRSMREAGLKFLLDWRSLSAARDPGSALCRWTSLHGRAMSLRLFLERGGIRPAFPLGALAHAFVKAFPEEDQWVRANILEAFVLGDWGPQREFWARQARAIRHSLEKTCS
jgi:GT2 family glycosyltransferase